MSMFPRPAPAVTVARWRLRQIETDRLPGPAPPLPSPASHTNNLPYITQLMYHCD
ncbi:hypothetical protein JYU34_000812 [Plutella xylostella]|uniref:Uncharacterized protein n=1 Tax=Plutella xylostella TaxID=51655 RepID=A0ABQ7R8K2_PLUXY|nr:hypothetical protein JYU34_000812 [Plutella xylostella]